MKTYTYEYALLRYEHDPVSQESLNIGVLVYSKESKYLELMVTTTYGRLSEAFAGFDGSIYQSIVQHLNAKTIDAQRRFFSRDRTIDPPDRLIDLLPSVLIANDSSYLFSNIGSGITPNLSATLESLYARLVTRYVKSSEDSLTRDDNIIWNIFASALSEKSVMGELQSKRIETPTFEYEFDFAWQNEKWHPLQPLSLDFQSASAIHQKANRWIGNISLLRKNQELGTVFFLIGRPNSLSGAVQKAYADAVANIRTIEDVEIYEEGDAEEFAGKLARRIARHKQQVKHR